MTSTGDQVDYLVTEYQFPGRNICVSAQSGAVATKGIEFEHGYDVYFERATLRHNSATNPKVDCFTGDERRELQPRIADAFVEQLRTAVEGLRTGSLPTALAGRSARNSLAIVLAEAESARRGERVAINV